MKKFGYPEMNVIHLSKEIITYDDSILCGEQVCYGFDCPDCPTICTGIYHCEIFKCTTYDT